MNNGDPPPVCIVLLTYDRLPYALQTLRTTLERVVTTRGVLLHIADDGTGEEYVQALTTAAREYPVVHDISFSDSGHHGYGANYNRATQVVHDKTDVVLPLEDDWELVRPLPLDDYADLVRSYDGVACIRLGYLGHTQALLGEVRSTGTYQFLLLDPASPEPHVFSGHPRIETVEYERRVGLWPEELSPGQTEFAVAHRDEARVGVAWPLGREDYFAHIGTIKADWKES